jgi:hypothetical protein
LVRRKGPLGRQSRLGRAACRSRRISRAGAIRPAHGDSDRVSAVGWPLVTSATGLFRVLAPLGPKAQPPTPTHPLPYRSGTRLTLLLAWPPPLKSLPPYTTWLYSETLPTFRRIALTSTFPSIRAISSGVWPCGGLRQGQSSRGKWAVGQIRRGWGMSAKLCCSSPRPHQSASLPRFVGLGRASGRDAEAPVGVGV